MEIKPYGQTQWILKRAERQNTARTFGANNGASGTGTFRLDLANA
jgi:hypothetical protein